MLLCKRGLKLAIFQSTARYICTGPGTLHGVIANKSEEGCESGGAEPEVEARTRKTVRKLIVGLGNPGPSPMRCGREKKQETLSHAVERVVLLR